MSSMGLVEWPCWRQNSVSVSLSKNNGPANSKHFKSSSLCKQLALHTQRKSVLERSHRHSSDSEGNTTSSFASMTSTRGYLFLSNTTQMGRKGKAIRSVHITTLTRKIKRNICSFLASFFSIFAFLAFRPYTSNIVLSSRPQTRQREKPRLFHSEKRKKCISHFFDIPINLFLLLWVDARLFATKKVPKRKRTHRMYKKKYRHMYWSRSATDLNS